jgi:AmmeMemoRadiSam system protein B
MGKTRRAFHAGNWYPSNRFELEKQLGKFVDAAILDETSGRSPKVIVAPHAGLSYSGQTAAFAYKAINPEVINTIFLLGPSHRIWLEKGAGLSTFSHFQSPLGIIELDSQSKIGLSCSSSKPARYPTV